MPSHSRRAFVVTEIIVLVGLIVGLIAGTIAVSDKLQKFTVKKKAAGDECMLVGDGNQRGCWCTQSGWKNHCFDPNSPLPDPADFGPCETECKLKSVTEAPAPAACTGIKCGGGECTDGRKFEGDDCYSGICETRAESFCGKGNIKPPESPPTPTPAPVNDPCDIVGSTHTCPKKAGDEAWGQCKQKGLPDEECTSQAQAAYNTAESQLPSQVTTNSNYQRLKQAGEAQTVFDQAILDAAKQAAGVTDSNQLDTKTQEALQQAQADFKNRALTSTDYGVDPEKLKEAAAKIGKEIGTQAKVTGKIDLDKAVIKTETTDSVPLENTPTQTSTTVQIDTQAAYNVRQEINSITDQITALGKRAASIEGGIEADIEIMNLYKKLAQLDQKLKTAAKSEADLYSKAGLTTSQITQLKTKIDAAIAENEHQQEINEHQQEIFDQYVSGNYNRRNCPNCDPEQAADKTLSLLTPENQSLAKVARATDLALQNKSIADVPLSADELKIVNQKVDRQRTLQTYIAGNSNEIKTKCLNKPGLDSVAKSYCSNPDTALSILIPDLTPAELNSAKPTHDKNVTLQLTQAEAEKLAKINTAALKLLQASSIGAPDRLVEAQQSAIANLNSADQAEARKRASAIQKYIDCRDNTCTNQFAQLQQFLSRETLAEINRVHTGNQVYEQAVAQAQAAYQNKVIELFQPRTETLPSGTSIASVCTSLNQLSITTTTRGLSKFQPPITISTTTKTCPYGCSSGACIDTPTPEQQNFINSLANSPSAYDQAYASKLAELPKIQGGKVGTAQPEQQAQVYASQTPAAAAQFALSLCTNPIDPQAEQKCLNSLSPDKWVSAYRISQNSDLKNLPQADILSGLVDPTELEKRYRQVASDPVNRLTLSYNNLTQGLAYQTSTAQKTIYDNWLAEHQLTDSPATYNKFINDVAPLLVNPSNTYAQAKLALTIAQAIIGNQEAQKDLKTSWDFTRNGVALAAPAASIAVLIAAPVFLPVALGGISGAAAVPIIFNAAGQTFGIYATTGSLGQTAYVCTFDVGWTSEQQKTCTQAAGNTLYMAFSTSLGFATNAITSPQQAQAAIKLAQVGTRLDFVADVKSALNAATAAKNAAMATSGLQHFAAANSVIGIGLFGSQAIDECITNQNKDAMSCAINFGMFISSLGHLTSYGLAQARITPNTINLNQITSQIGNRADQLDGLNGCKDLLRDQSTIGQCISSLWDGFGDDLGSKFTSTRTQENAPHIGLNQAIANYRNYIGDRDANLASVREGIMRASQTLAQMQTFSAQATKSHPNTKLTSDLQLAIDHYQDIIQNTTTISEEINQAYQEFQKAARRVLTYQNLVGFDPRNAFQKILPSSSEIQALQAAQTELKDSVNSHNFDQEKFKTASAHVLIAIQKITGTVAPKSASVLDELADQAEIKAQALTEAAKQTNNDPAYAQAAKEAAETASDLRQAAAAAAAQPASPQIQIGLVKNIQLSIESQLFAARLKTDSKTVQLLLTAAELNPDACTNCPIYVRQQLNAIRNATSGNIGNLITEINTHSRTKENSPILDSLATLANKKAATLAQSATTPKPADATPVQISPTPSFANRFLTAARNLVKQVPSTLKPATPSKTPLTPITATLKEVRSTVNNVLGELPPIARQIAKLAAVRQLWMLDRAIATASRLEAALAAIQGLPESISDAVARVAVTYWKAQDLLSKRPPHSFPALTTVRVTSSDPAHTVNMLVTIHSATGNAAVISFPGSPNVPISGSRTIGNVTITIQNSRVSFTSTLPLTATQEPGPGPEVPPAHATNTSLVKIWQSLKNGLTTLTNKPITEIPPLLQPLARAADAAESGFNRITSLLSLRSPKSQKQTTSFSLKASELQYIYTTPDGEKLQAELHPSGMITLYWLDPNQPQSNSFEASLSPGEGRIVRYKQTHIKITTDSNGRLSLSPYSPPWLEKLGNLIPNTEIGENITRYYRTVKPRYDSPDYIKQLTVRTLDGTTHHVLLDPDNNVEVEILYKTPQTGDYFSDDRPTIRARASLDQIQDLLNSIPSDANSVEVSIWWSVFHPENLFTDSYTSKNYASLSSISSITLADKLQNLPQFSIFNILFDTVPKPKIITPLTSQTTRFESRVEGPKGLTKVGPDLLDQASRIATNIWRYPFTRPYTGWHPTLKDFNPFVTKPNEVLTNIKLLLWDIAYYNQLPEFRNLESEQKWTTFRDKGSKHYRDLFVEKSYVQWVPGKATPLSYYEGEADRMSAISKLMEENPPTSIASPLFSGEEEFFAPGKVVVELGSGEGGALLQYHQTYPGATYVGVDIGYGTRNVVATPNLSLATKPQFVNDSWDSLEKIPNDSVDSIFSVEGAFRWGDEQKVAAAITRVAKNGAVVRGNTHNNINSVITAFQERGWTIYETGKDNFVAVKGSSIPSEAETAVGGGTKSSPPAQPLRNFMSGLANFLENPISAFLMKFGKPVDSNLFLIKSEKFQFSFFEHTQVELYPQTYLLNTTIVVDKNGRILASGVYPSDIPKTIRNGVDAKKYHVLSLYQRHSDPRIRVFEEDLSHLPLPASDNLEKSLNKYNSLLNQPSSKANPIRNILSLASLGSTNALTTLQNLPLAIYVSTQTTLKDFLPLIVSKTLEMTFPVAGVEFLLFFGHRIDPAVLTACYTIDGCSGFPASRYFIGNTSLFGQVLWQATIGKIFAPKTNEYGTLLGQGDFANVYGNKTTATVLYRSPLTNQSSIQHQINQYQKYGGGILPTYVASITKEIAGGPYFAGFQIEQISSATTLKEYFKQGRSLPPEIVNTAISQLNSLHQRGFLHGDIHPSNILVQFDNDDRPARIVLIDPLTPGTSVAHFVSTPEEELQVFRDLLQSNKPTNITPKLVNLATKITANLNIESILNIAKAGPTRWKAVIRDVITGVLGDPNSKIGQQIAKESLKKSQQAGIDTQLINTTDIFGKKSFVIESSLTNEKSVLAYPQPLNHESPYTRAHVALVSPPTDRSYIAINPPTSLPDATNEHLYNNGAIIVSPDGTIFEHGPLNYRGERTQPQIDSSRGGIAISSLLDNYPFGKITAFSPKKIAETRTNPTKYFPYGGIIIGVSNYFVIPNSSKSLSREEIDLIIEKVPYKTSYNRSFSFVYTRGGKLRYTKVVVDPNGSTLERAIFSLITSLQSYTEDIEVVMLEEGNFTDIETPKSISKDLSFSDVSQDPVVLSDIPLIFISTKPENPLP